MPESVRDRWLSIGMSVLLHGSLIALLAFGWWHFRQQATPAPSVPINATVVDARTLKGAGTAATAASKPKSPPPHPQPEQPPPEGPPPPTPDEIAMREQAAKEEAQHEAQAQQELQAREQARAAREAAEQQAEAQAAAKAAADKQAEEAEAAVQAKAAAAKKKAAAAKLAVKKAAEQRKLAEDKKLAEQKALAAQRQAEQERAARVAELQQSLQADERATAASGALASWTTELESRIQQHWIRPPTAQAGIDCVLNVSVVSGGEVTDVSLGQCNGDAAVRESIKNAVYAASPLPPPPNNIAFPHQLAIEFKPTN